MCLTFCNEYICQCPIFSILIFNSVCAVFVFHQVYLIALKMHPLLKTMQVLVKRCCFQLLCQSLWRPLRGQQALLSKRLWTRPVHRSYLMSRTQEWHNLELQQNLPSSCRWHPNPWNGMWNWRKSPAKEQSKSLVLWHHFLGGEMFWCVHTHISFIEFQ